jgi:hypothetical protein
VDKKITKSIQNSSGDVLFYEGFEQNSLPDNWTDTIHTNVKSWIFAELPDFPFKNINSQSPISAICPWNNDTTDIKQNEWLISSEINLPAGYKSISLDMYAGFSKTWLANANLEIWAGIVSGTTVSWSKVWNAQAYTDTLSSSWTWRKVSTSLIAFQSQNIKLGIHYTGNNGDLIAVDDISINGYKQGNGADILSFTVNNQKSDAVITAQKDSIHVEMLYGTDFTKLIPQFSLSSGATSSPSSGDTINVTPNEVFPITVTSEDGLIIKTWQLVAIEATVSKEAKIISFSVPTQTGTATIDDKNSIIQIEIDCKTDLTKLVPTLSISKAATIYPAIGDTISAEVNIPYFYTVVAQDTTISQKWQVIFSFCDYTANILNFTLPGQSGSSLVDQVNNTVFLEMNYGSALENIIPTITLADCATSSPASGEAVSFTNKIPETFIVQPKDTSLKPTTWEVTVQLKNNTLFVEEFDAAESIPSNWTLTAQADKTWIFENQQANSFTNLYSISKYSAICPWSSSQEQNEWLTSPLISTQSFVDAGVTDLKLSFYAGYNYSFMHGFADLIVKIKKASQTDWTPIWQIPEDDAKASSWYWHQVIIPIDSYLGSDIQIAFAYQGINGDLVGIDDIQMYSNPFTGIFHTTSLNNDIQIYPNPAKLNLNLSAKNNGTLSIIDLSGRIVLTKQVYAGNTTIDISNLKQGLYIARFINNERISSTQKFQIQ